MKSKLFLSAVLFHLLLLCTSCRDDSRLEIVENHTISVCGVTDPLRNVDWLARFCKNQADAGISISIRVYRNKSTDENHYVISFVNHKPVEYSREEVYDCSGQKLFFKGIEGPTPTGWDEFFQGNEFVVTIWTVEQK
jgi:hypothetical protein